MRTIKLYGELGKKFGVKYNLDVLSASEAIRAIANQVYGFEKYLIDSEKNGIGYRVFDNNAEVFNTKDLHLSGTGEIKIIPVVCGTNAEFRTIIGTALIIAATYMTGGTASAISGAGYSLAIGGTIEVLTRGMFKTHGPQESSQQNTPSYSFSGPVNTTQQGHPVPLGYGRLRVGGAIISASLSTESLLAGYTYIDVQKYKDITAQYTADNYGNTPPPPNYFKKELISSGSTPFYVFNSIAYTIPYWVWRFYYIDKELQLRTI